MNYYKKNSALDTIKKKKISIILEDPYNKTCFECSKPNPEYISINNAIFLCNECVQNHLKLPKSISYIINNNINNLSMKNIQYLSYGGNKNLNEFIINNFPNLMNLSSIYLYQTYAMEYYRKTIEYFVEGGMKPIKPDNNIAYEIINLNNKEKNDIGKYLYLNKKEKKQKLIRKIKSDSFIKFRNNPHPKIKPIIGTNSESKLTHFSNQNRNNKNKFSQTTTNFQNNNFHDYSLDDNNNYKTHFKLNTTSFENKRSFYPNFKSNYDIDDDINYNLSNIKANIYEYNNISTQTNNFNIREKILNRNDSPKDIKILNSNPTIIKNTNNNIYARYMSQNYLNSHNSFNSFNEKKLYRNDNTYNISRNNNTTIFNYDRRKNINNMELRDYLQNKCKEKENYIFNLKLNSAKPTLINGLNEEEIKEIKKNANINNINNNIIINRNLNVFYNNNNSYNNSDTQKIFKKKTVGNSFSHLEKKTNMNNYNHNNSMNKTNYYIPLTSTQNSFNIQKNKNKKIIKRNEIQSNFIKVNKIKTISKINHPKTLNNINNNEYENNNYISNNIQLNIKRNLNIEKFKNQFSINDKNEEGEENQESKIIQRISRVFKIQKERQEKMISLNINNKHKKNNTIDSNIEPNNFKFKIINVEKIKNKNKEKEKDKEKTKQKGKNNLKEIKIKIYKRNDISNRNNILVDPQNINHSLMRELINLPSGKKKNIVGIIKANVLANKSVSPGVKRILKISSNKKAENNL